MTKENKQMACESAQEIINVLATAEACAVTLLGGALENAANGKLALNDEQQQALKAARAQEQAHYVFLTAAGAKPLTTTFTLPDPKIVTDAGTFLKTLIALEESFVAAYLAASQVFAVLGEAKWVQHSLAIGAVEAEHRVAVRFFAIEAGMLDGLPNDIAFEKAKFVSVGAAAAELKELGFIGGSGAQISYPGPGSIDNTGVKHLTP
ncbi:MAG: ferritin-like domain-containing protein [Dehalococcoidia bacterium]